MLRYARHPCDHKSSQPKIIRQLYASSRGARHRLITGPANGNVLSVRPQSPARSASRTRHGDRDTTPRARSRTSLAIYTADRTPPPNPTHKQGSGRRAVGRSPRIRREGANTEHRDQNAQRNRPKQRSSWSSRPETSEIQPADRGEDRVVRRTCETSGWRSGSEGKRQLHHNPAPVPVSEVRPPGDASTSTTMQAPSAS